MSKKYRCAILIIVNAFIFTKHWNIVTTSISQSNFLEQHAYLLHQEHGQKIWHTEESVAHSAATASKIPAASYISVSPLEAPLDYEQFTIRINTWKRTEQLKVSLLYYSSCAGVAQIQIVWCLEQGPPPDWLGRMVNGTYDWNNEVGVVAAVPSTPSFSRQNFSAAPSHRALISLELHVKNSLNERFHVMKDPPTKGILSVDDDFLRPCLALDAGFFLWTQHPERLVGYDARTHFVVFDNDHENNNNNKTVSNNTINSTQELRSESSGHGNNRKQQRQKTQQWKYGDSPTTHSINQYSLTLTKCSFQHVDYLKGYIAVMPAMMRDRVSQVKNCEDIAMSLWISYAVYRSQQQQLVPEKPQPPLLVDYWAQQLRIKMYVPDGISSTSEHEALRDECVNDFSDILGLKELNFTPIEFIHYAHQPLFQSGLKLHRLTSTKYHLTNDSVPNLHYISHRSIQLEQEKQAWLASNTSFDLAMNQLRSEIRHIPFLYGLIPKKKTTQSNQLNTSHV